MIRVTVALAAAVFIFGGGFARVSFRSSPPGLTRWSMQPPLRAGPVGSHLRTTPGLEPHSRLRQPTLPNKLCNAAYVAFLCRD